MAINGVTPRQKKAIAALLSESNVKAAAVAAGVGERTLSRWLSEDSKFNNALSVAEGRLIEDAGRLLLRGQVTALRVLDRLMVDGSESNQRLAAVAWLDNCMKIRELKSIEDRLSRLEEAYDAIKK